MQAKQCYSKLPPSSRASSPIRVIEQDSAQGVGWVTRYLNRE
jgi:hypothetical protein